MGLIRRSHLPPDCHLRHQLLHLSQKCLLPAHEKHHQVREKPFSGHLPPPPGPEPAFTPASYVPCRVAVLDKVTDFLFLLGKLLIVGSVGECCLAAERLLEALCELLSAPMPSMRTVFSGVFLGGGGAFPLSRTLNHLHFLLLSRDPGFLLLHSPNQDRAGHSTTPQLLLGPYSGMKLWGVGRGQGEGDVGTHLASSDWTEWKQRWGMANSGHKRLLSPNHGPGLPW